VTAGELISRLPAEERARVPEDMTGAFVSESSQIAYPIVGRIACFLEQTSLQLAASPSLRDAESLSVQQSVKRWYDEFGWLRNESGLYNDTALFSQESVTAHGIYELDSHISLLDRLSGGDFLLDAASGPIPHAEYLAYSWPYKHRVCVDLSLVALREADAKLQENGFCCMADISRLPFQDGVFDGVISGYTIQHIGEAQQSEAVAELYRVLKPGNHLCIITDLQRSGAHRALMLTLRIIRKSRHLLSIGQSRVSREQNEQRPVLEPPHQLYFHAQNLAWWRNQAHQLTNSYSLEGLRIFAKDEFEFLFGHSIRSAKIVRALEALFPKFAAKICSYLLVDIFKPRPSAAGGARVTPRSDL
jgi:ubiquinone/menaquinone biosynthesis C-methylase UbiE